jgi:hypothetical protein
MNVTAYSIVYRQLAQIECSDRFIGGDLIKRQTRTAGIAIGSGDLSGSPRELPPSSLLFIIPSSTLASG